MKWKRVAAFVAVAVPVLALLAFGFTRDARSLPSPLLGQPAPPFRLVLFDGSTLDAEALRGKVIFVNFWASWCVPCREEARVLEAAWLKYKDADVVFVGVNIQDSVANARAFLAEFGVTYPNGRDESKTIAVEYGVWGIPETFIIGRDGRITYKHAAALAWPTLTTKLEEALRGIVSTREHRKL